MPKQTRFSRKPTISIVGAGNLGTALAHTLSAAGYRIATVGTRSKKAGTGKLLAKRIKAGVVEIGKEPLETDLVWLTVPDDAIAGVAEKLARSQDWKGKFVFHSSGALTSDELIPLRDKGARTASVHPMMTFVRGVVPQTAGVSFAVEGDAAAARLARDIVESLDASVLPIQKQNKVLYHVFGSFASPLVISLMASLEQVAQAAGIRRQDIKPVMVPLLWQTISNYLKHDAPTAFSGPLVRGDVATVRKHLAELSKLPEAREVYIALAKAALKNLPVKNRAGISQTMKQGKTRRRQA